jgi:hypothetical protein
MTVRSFVLRQNPAYRPRESSPITMRTTSRSAVIAAVSGCSLLAACRSGTVPNQILTKPAPAIVPAPPPRTTGPWSYRPSIQRQGFVVDQRAVISVRFDTSTHIDTISSHAEVAFTNTPAANSVTGSVGVFLVQGAGRGAATPAGLVTPFPVRAEYSGRGLQLDFTAPRDLAPCASTALAVAQSLRDLWFRPPDTLRVGTAWEDSSSYVVCRDGIPLRATVHRAFRISGSGERDGRLLVMISRTSRTVIEGAGVQFGEAVSVSGRGNGELVYDLDPASGEILSAKGSTTLEFSLRSRLRGQLVRQTVELQIGRS